VTVVGRTYLERGKRVTVLVRWGYQKPQPGPCTSCGTLRPDVGPDVRTACCGVPNRLLGSGPRNVLIQRADGSRVVRPFRGLRCPPPPA
jgi:hypothetical protein